MENRRRQRYSEATKRALVEVAEQLFTEHGYAATSLDAIAAGADVTKGALYHHFSGKQAIFEAAFERVESGAASGIAQATEGHRDPWDKARAGLRAFLAAVQEPGYRQVVVSDGPSVLGHERYREQEERSTYAIVDEIVRSVLTDKDLPHDDARLDDAMLDTFTRIFFGAMSAAGGSVAVSDDPAAAAQRVETAVGVILAGLERLLEEDAGAPRAAPVDAGTTSRT
jgi:AcrR family transcriptional regulator